MKKLLTPALCLGLLASSVAFAQSQLNRYHANPPAGHGAPAAPTAAEEFDRTVHPNYLSLCVKEVNEACDNQLESEIVAAFNQGKRSTLFPTADFLDAALKSRGVQGCGHISSRTGATSNEVFLKKGALLVFKTFRSEPCTSRMITLTTGEAVQSLSPSKYRAWITTSAGRVLYMLSTTAVYEYKNFRGKSSVSVSADGSQITISNTSTANVTSTETVSDIDGIRQGDIDNERVLRSQPATPVQLLLQ